MIGDPRQSHRFLQKSSRAGCGGRPAYRSVPRTGMRTGYLQQEAKKREINHETFVQMNAVKQTNKHVKSFKGPLPNQLCQETNASEASPSCTSLISTAPGSFQPIRNNVIIGVLAGRWKV